MISIPPCACRPVVMSTPGEGWGPLQAKPLENSRMLLEDGQKPGHPVSCVERVHHVICMEYRLEVDRISQMQGIEA